MLALQYFRVMFPERLLGVSDKFIILLYPWLRSVDGQQEYGFSKIHDGLNPDGLKFCVALCAL